MKKMMGWGIFLLMCFVFTQKVVFCADELMDALPFEILSDGPSEGTNTIEEFIMPQSQILWDSGLRT